MCSLTLYLPHCSKSCEVCKILFFNNSNYVYNNTTKVKEGPVEHRDREAWASVIPGIYSSVQIIVLNSLHNRYAKHNKDFSPPLTRGFVKSCIVWYNFGYQQYFLWKQYTMDE